MIQGRSGGSGKYSYREVHGAGRSVLVAHMPEEQFDVRIVFRSQGETSIPTVKLDLNMAQFLWSALCAMAKDLSWEDKTFEERMKELEHKK